MLQLGAFTTLFAGTGAAEAPVASSTAVRISLAAKEIFMDTIRCG